MTSTFNHGVGDAQINPPDYGEAHCADCGSIDCDEIIWDKTEVNLCRPCTRKRLEDVGELDEMGV